MCEKLQLPEVPVFGYRLNLVRPGFLPVLWTQSTEKRKLRANARPTGGGFVGKRESSGSVLLFDEGALDDVMSGGRMIALNETALVKDGAQILEHRGAAAEHHAIMLGIERWEA